MRVAVVAIAVAFATVAGLTLGAQTPDATVWSGVYSEAQAARGQAEYGTHCASCHQDDLSGYQSILRGDRFMNDTGKRTFIVCSTRSRPLCRATPREH